MKRWTSLLALAAAIALAPVWIGSATLAHFEGHPAAVSRGLAQAGEGYDLTWHAVSSGGYTFSTGGGYSMGGTIGQPGAGVLSGGSFVLVGGFWFGAAGQYRLYLPVVLRG